MHPPSQITTTDGYNRRNPYSKLSFVVKIVIIFGVCSLFYLSGICSDSDRSVKGFGDTISARSSSAQSFEMAYRESDGFFDDIRENDWIRLKQRQKTYKFCKDNCKEKGKGAVWYQNNFEPSFTCQHEQRIGGMGDGPKWVCDPHRIGKNNCLVYSVGSSNQFQFEEHVYSEISKDCEIHTFDPTIGEHPSNKPDYVHFHPWGVAGKTGKTANGEMKTVPDLIQALGHENRSIDIFKIDCEGCEWESYSAWFTPQIRQVQVELHHIKKAEKLLRHAYDNNFVIFHKEPNTLGCGGNCIEYALVRLGTKFFT